MHLHFLHPHQIYKEHVDDFVPGASVPPKCELLVEWDPRHKDDEPVRLRHKINLIGASKPFNFYNLSLNPTWKDSTPVQLLSLIVTIYISNIHTSHSSTQIAVRWISNCILLHRCHDGLVIVCCFPIFKLQVSIPTLNSHV